MSDQIQSLDLLFEPAGESYWPFLECLIRFSRIGLLVTRDDLEGDVPGRALVDNLLLQGADLRAASEWPGTRLTLGTAGVIKFALSAKNLELLKGGPSQLFDWLSPQWPEDLCLIREDGSTLLGSISHERDAFVCLNKSEASQLELVVPGILGVV